MVAALEAWLRTADTVVVPPFSGIESSATESATVGASSSSVIVPAPAAVPTVPPTALLNRSTTVSSGSSVVSPVTDTVIVSLVSPAVKVRVPEVSAA